MFATNMPQSTTLMPTPGANFVNRKPSFNTKINDFHHYKLDNYDGFNSLQNKKRTTINVSFNSFKNEVDPYVHASNWLPKFKSHCRGYLARKNVSELRKKNDAVLIIQRAAENFLDPLVQIFHIIRPTLKISKMDDLKKYLRECIIQIKKLNAERMFIENQLDEVESTLDRSLIINDNNCLSLEGRKSPNMFGKMSEIKENANNDNFLKECLDLKIEGLDDIDIQFDANSCRNSKIHVVYEKSDKLQFRIHENKHKLQELMTKCENLEKEIRDLRSSNTTLDSTGRIMKGIIHKHDREKEEQTNRLNDLEELFKQISEEKKQIANRLKETEAILAIKTENADENFQKSEHFESELDKKRKAFLVLNQEKLNADKKIKELEESINYNNEIQQELETNLELQKVRMKEMKKRFLEQIRSTEEELIAEKSGAKLHIQDLNESLENLMENIKQKESIIWKLERAIKDSVDNHGSDEDTAEDKERERKLSLQLKHYQANMESQKEELRIMEHNYDETKKKNQEVENKLEIATQQETEYKKQIERLKSQIQTLKSNYSETELNYNRNNREKNYLNQKYNQTREINISLENDISKLKDELAAQNQLLITKSKEIDNLEEELSVSKRDYESKITLLERHGSDLQSQIDRTNEKLNQVQEEMKKTTTTLKQELEDHKQMIEDKEIELDNANLGNLKLNQTIKKLQKRIDEQDEIQNDFEKTIMKLKDENKSLKEDKDNETPNTIMVTDYRTRDYVNRDRETRLGRSSSSMSSTSPVNNSGFFTLPGRNSGRYQS